jgi:hypothetical protein
MIIQNRLAALREVMSVASNVPPDLSIADLKAKFAVDPEFCKNLNHRLIRFLALRTELTPYILVKDQILRLFEAFWIWAYAEMAAGMGCPGAICQVDRHGECGDASPL